MWFKKNYKTKRGYLTSEKDALRGGTLIIYDNGLVIVQDDLYGRNYEVQKLNDVEYEVIDNSGGYGYKKFLLSE